MLNEEKLKETIKEQVLLVIRNISNYGLSEASYLEILKAVEGEVKCRLYDNTTDKLVGKVGEAFHMPDDAYMGNYVEGFDDESQISVVESGPRLP